MNSKYHKVSSNMDEILSDLNFSFPVVRKLLREASRHDNRAELKIPTAPKKFRIRRPLASDQRCQRWWSRRWPNDAPTVINDLPESVGTSVLGAPPKLEKPRQAPSALRALGKLGPTSKMRKKDLSVEEQREIERQKELQVLLDLVSTAVHEHSKKNGKTYVINTVDYYPLVRRPVNGLQNENQSPCRYNKIGRCRRGFRCTFSHSESCAEENLRRLSLKFVARVKWAMGKGRPVWPPRFEASEIPTPLPWVWEDVQLPQLPCWCLTYDQKANSSPEQYISDLCAELRNSASKIRRFELRKCPLTPITMEILCNSLNQCRTLGDLSLAYCDVLDDSAGVLAEGIAGFCALRSLEVSFSNITSVGAVHITKACIACASLTSLILRSNPVGDHGAISLAKLLQLTNLRNLNLASSDIGDPGWNALSRAVHNSSSICSLVLDGTSPSVDGCLSMLQALKINTELTNLSLRFVNAATPTLLIHIAKLLEKNAEFKKKRRKRLIKAVAIVTGGRK